MYLWVLVEVSINLDPTLSSLDCTQSSKQKVGYLIGV